MNTHVNYIKYILFYYLLSTSATTEAQTSAQKIAMIERIEAFAKKEFRLKTLPNFYTEWQLPDSTTAYLYVSRNDTMLAIPEIPSFKFFGTNYLQAYQSQNHYDSLGFHTLVYKTAGNSGCKLSSRLLSYSNECIAFIALHELFHRHKQAAKVKIPYSLEESACDVLGLQGLKKYIERTNDTLLQMEDALSLEKYIEGMARVLSSVDFSFRQKQQMVAKINEQMTYTKHKLFLGDRYHYPLNYAYLLRNHFYNDYYFELKSLYESFSPHEKKYIKFIGHLKTGVSINEQIKNKIEKNKLP
jgi:hypothetical protein